MKTKKGIILLAIAAIAFGSCKDEPPDPPTPVAKTRTELITTGSWITTDILLNGYSIWALSDPCSKDNFMTFKTNGTVITDEGATKCDPADPQTITKDWKFINSEKKIIVGTDTADLNVLNETIMEISAKDDLDVTVIKFKKK